MEGSYFATSFMILATLATATSASGSPYTSKQYRSDYVYNSKTDAFYKLHVEGASQTVATSSCAAEGAKVMLAESDQDIEQLHGMFKKFPDLGNYVRVGSDGKSTVESDEDEALINMGPESDIHVSNLCGVATRNGDITEHQCYGQLPFICKVTAREAPYNAECDVFASDYVSKISTTGSCYRISRVPADWNEAHEICKTEGAHLIILNNAGEFEVVKAMLQATPRSIESWQFFAGLRAEKKEPVVFRTVFNQTLEEVGYMPWDDHEPNNMFNVEYCVSILRSSGKYNDTVCKNRYSYVCEKEKHASTQ